MMGDWLSPWMSWQRDAVRAQQAGWDAMRRAIDAGEQMTAMQDATRRATEANLRAWEEWAKLWGVGR